MGVAALCLLLAGAAPAAGEPAGEPAAAPQSVDGIKEAIFAQLGLGAGMVVAEIGAGKGWFALNAAQAVGARGRVFATDIDAATVAGLRQRAVHLPPAAAQVEVRLCAGPRDTALDDLPDGSVDVISMIDSLCFDGSEPRAVDLDYLRRLFRILRPGGHLVHHMDCRCDITAPALAALFAEAGFGAPLPYRDIPQPPPAELDWDCRTEVQRRRHAWLGRFPKPLAPRAAPSDGAE